MNKLPDPGTDDSVSLPRILRGRRLVRFGYLVANGIAQAVVAVATALLVKSGYDQLVQPGVAVSGRPLILFGGSLLVALAVGAGLRWRGHVDAEQLGQGYVHAVRLQLFRHVTRLGMDGIRQMSRGAIMLRFVGDLTALRNWVSLGLSRLTVSGLTACLSIAALTIIEPVIAVTVGVAILGAAALALTIGPLLRSRTREVRRRRGRLAGSLNDRVSRIGVVEAFGQELREQERFDKLSRSLRASLVHQARTVGLLRALSEASAGFATLCALFVGAIQVGMGLATPGAVVGAMVVAGLLAPRLQDLGRVYEYWNAALIARQKQEQLLGLKADSRPRQASRHQSLSPGSGRLSLTGITHPGLAGPIDLEVPAGRRLCVVGPNGAGKSTLLRIIAGLLKPDSGEVCLDGQRVDQIRWTELRSAFAMVSPDLPLLRGSLRLNLTYGARDVPTSEIERVIAQCGLADLIERRGAGLNARISENGEGLSTGERGRIALARALLVHPRVLLLDEAEANFDRNGLALLDEIIARFSGTVIYTTHSLQRIGLTDHHLVLPSGPLDETPDPTAARGDPAGDAMHSHHFNQKASP